MNGVKYHRL